MPTYAEIKAMIDATYWAMGPKGYYVFAPDASHSAGTVVGSIPGDLDKSDALLFIPAAGYGFQTSYSDAGSHGFYWSSTIYPSPHYAYTLYIYTGSTVKLYNRHRYLGQSVRPISD